MLGLTPTSSSIFMAKTETPENAIWATLTISTNLSGGRYDGLKRDKLLVNLLKINGKPSTPNYFDQDCLLKSKSQCFLEAKIKRIQTPNASLHHQLYVEVCVGVLFGAMTSFPSRMPAVNERGCAESLSLNLSYFYSLLSPACELLISSSHLGSVGTQDSRSQTVSVVSHRSEATIPFSFCSSTQKWINTSASLFKSLERSNWVLSGFLLELW